MTTPKEKSTNLEPIAILGAGSFGTALALYLSRLGQAVRLWTPDQTALHALKKERVNTRYLPGHSFPENLELTSDLPDAIKHIKDILIAVPSDAFREVITLLKPLLTSETRVAWVTKGLDPVKNQLLHETAEEVLGKKRAYAVLSGPSFAREVAKGLPTAIVAASTDSSFTQDLIHRFNSPLFRVYSSSDIIGVEIGGIVKNVLAIAIGISDGMELGANARSALITRGLAEMIRLGTALHGKKETFIGLTGLGDLVLTCTDDQSRNRRFGVALGQGKNAKEAEHAIGQVVEGKRNAELIVKLAEKNKIEMPITEMVWEILHKGLTPKTAMQTLLSRETKAEN
ncbi:MAG: hypothetical protein ACD_60C00058G0004 [uncultured bacterium]|nr:MAG: hypothetical protein ACD_60C00058G0004 [uncultured bacterium]